MSRLQNYSPKLFLRQYIFFWFRILFYLKFVLNCIKGIFFFFPNGYNKIVSSSLLIWNAMIIGMKDICISIYRIYKIRILFCSIGLFIFSSTDTVWVLISEDIIVFFCLLGKIFNHSWQITPSKFSSRDELSQVEPKPGKC